MPNGKTFYFQVNDQDVYMKGANQVPLDYFPSRMKNRTELEWLFFSAERANFNVLRIWAGGMYMTDEFYEMADERGMLIWQDMMFSCRTYPYQKESFIENSLKEVRQQVGRLQHHASIVHWVLNNEGEAMFYWRSNRGKKDAYYQQYTYFYVERMVPVMVEAGIQVSQNFMDTSPSNGVTSFDPYVKFTDLNPQDQHYGDAHYYYLTLDCEDQNTFPQFRFLSESGFQSEPTLQDYLSVSEPEDWSQNSEFLKKRTTFNQDHGVMLD